MDKLYGTFSKPLSGADEGDGLVGVRPQPALVSDHADRPAERDAGKGDGDVQEHHLV